MGLLLNDCKSCLYCMAGALTSMNFALFLHPMSPGDFFQLAIADPLLMLGDPNGGGFAVLFWISLTLFFAGLLGVLGRCLHPRRALLQKKHHLNARVV